MMVDLHTHILPSIDDGAEDLDTSLAMLKIAVEGEIRDIFLTPHFIPGSFDNTADIVLEQWKNLKKAVDKAGIEVSLYPGNEVFITPEVPALLREGKICTLNQSRYVLIELPMGMVPEYTKDVLYEVRLQGFVPIIAHPERNMMIGRKPDLLRELVQQGALAQANATSITGIYGKGVQKIVMNLIAQGLIHFISSDAHTCRGRAPKLLSARTMVEKKFGKELARALFEENGFRVINNTEVQTWEVKDPIKPGFWERIFESVRGRFSGT